MSLFPMEFAKRMKAILASYFAHYRNREIITTLAVIIYSN